ncbi:MAG TPA: TonB-dependent receptor, partial [Gemmatimonadaceae bacterium]|nr:TonB-dependent receptor [Gemmatimonadaceae bacterium]
MRSSRAALVAAFLLNGLFAPARVAAAQAPTPGPAPQPGLISGRVFDAVTEEPLAGVTVRVVGQDIATQSDDAGRFALANVRPGIVQLEARRIGYAPLLRGDVAVSAGKPVVVTLALARLDVRLQGVIVRPSPFPPSPPAATPVSSTTLTSEELRRTPGASEDVLQALSIAPGVATTTAGRNDLFVRGGAAYENLFVVDNVEVPNINHFGTQGNTGGPLSLLNIRFIDNATLSAGGFGVRYGDRLSSSTVLTLRDGNRERLSGELNVAASQYGAIVEGPVGGNASFLLNVRQSYLDLLFKALGQSFIPSYTDAVFKATWRPSRRDAVSFLTIGAIDRVAFTNDDAEQRVDNSRILAPSQRQYFSGLTWKRLFDNGVATTTLGRTWTRYRTAQFDSLTPPGKIFEANTTEGENSLRTDLTWQPRPSLEVDVGNIAKLASALRYDVTIPGFLRVDAGGSPRPLRVDTTFTAFRNATYAQATWQATPRVRLTAGARGDHYDFLAESFA